MKKLIDEAMKEVATILSKRLNRALRKASKKNESVVVPIPREPFLKLARRARGKG